MDWQGYETDFVTETRRKIQVVQPKTFFKRHMEYINCNNMNKFFFSIAILCGLHTGIAQITGKIIDGENGEPIPYANITINNSENQISNIEGYFTIPESSNRDDTALKITFFGFAGIQTTVGQLKSRDMIVKMKPVVFELDEVKISERPSAAAIMAEVKKNLKANYAWHPTLSKDVLFFREANTFKPSKLEVEITKSTGFSKNGLKEANKDISALTSSLISNPTKEFTDMLGNYYTSPSQTKGEKSFQSKLDVVRATKLKDDSRSGSIEDMEKSATMLFLKHLDTTKYYRIKSGWFGSRDTVSLTKNTKKRKDKAAATNVASAKNRLYSLKTQSNYLYTKKLEFVTQPEIYNYKYEGAVYLSDNEYAYVLSFEPRKSRAVYQGKLYISESDFAVLRADYVLAPGKKVDGLNLKLLLGVKVAENVGSGTVIYKKDPIGEGYYLQYALEETGQYVYLNRPLKFIELTDEEKDVVAFDLKVEGNILNRNEFLNMSRTTVSGNEYAKIKEDEFAYMRIRQYDPKIWKDYVSIEPLEEMKRYKVADAAP